jgi:hypothetical protein
LRLPARLWLSVAAVGHRHLHHLEDRRGEPEFASTLAVNAKATKPTSGFGVLYEVPRVLICRLLYSPFRGTNHAPHYYAMRTFLLPYGRPLGNPINPSTRSRSRTEASEAV